MWGRMMDGDAFLSDIEQTLNQFFEEQASGYGGRPILAWDGSSRIWIIRTHEDEVFTEISAVLLPEPEGVDESQATSAWLDVFAKAWRPAPQSAISQKRVASCQFVAGSAIPKDVRQIVREAFEEARTEARSLHKRLSEVANRREYLRLQANVMRPGN